MKRISLAAVAALMCTGAAYAQSSNAARWLVGQEEQGACNGGNGRLSPAGIIERDLTGDGRADLILSHEHMDCTGRGMRSFCGMQVCSFKIFVREGDLLTPAVDMLGGGVSVGGGAVPAITGYAHGGQTWSMRWDGSRFR